jgi:hypothetical protein
MSAPRILLLAACLAASALPSVAAPGGAAASGPQDPAFLTGGSWFISLSPGARDGLRFFPIAAADADRLFLRRFATPSFYLDSLAGNDLKVLLWPEAKRRTLSFAPDGMSFLREASPIRVEYARTARAGKAEAGRSPAAYEGEWETGKPAMPVSIRACERSAWALVMYFPGDPLSAIPMGYYPLRPIGDGTYRSSAAFPDSQLELEYDMVSDSLLVRPLFKERPLAAELYDPVRAWRGR